MFNNIELFKIAQNLEQNGYLFYSEISKELNDPVFKDLFNDLANMENEHYKIFANLERKSKCINYADNDEVSMYLNQFTDKNIFNKNEIKNIISNFKNPIDIFKYSLEKEIETINYYKTIKKVLTDNDSLNALEKIIEEENNHVKLMNEYIAKLS